MSGFGKSLVRSKQRDQAERRKKYVAVLEARNAAAAESIAKRAGNQDMAESMSRRAGGSAVETDVGGKLKSVWDTTDIDSFLQMADQREAGYAAERSVKVVVDGAAHVFVGDKVRPLSDTQRDWLALSAQLPIPKRPPWSFEMSAHDVNVQELSHFADWRATLNELEESHKVILSPFERSLEVWRQLWRVVERSDIVVNVVDARNPLAFRCRDFEGYVAAHTSAATGRPKPLVLLLNKADLLTERQRLVWAEYLNKLGVTFYFFCAKPPDNTEKINKLREEEDVEEERLLRQKLKMAFGHHEEGMYDDEDEEEEEEEEGSDDSSFEDVDSEEERREARSRKLLELQEQQALPPAAAVIANKKSGRRGAKHRPLRGLPQQLAQQQMADEAQRRAAEYEQQLQLEEQQMRRDRYIRDQAEKKRRLEQAQARGGKGKQQQQQPKATAAAAAAELPPVPAGTSKVYSAAELVELFATFWRDRAVPEGTQSDNTTGSKKERQITVGFTGYPNVGKSSTINALIGAKKVVVSATPGKTKHLQTLPIPQEDRVMLCDCPGLVFPTCAATKETMVCDGVLPIDNCKDFVAPISVVCRRIPSVVLQHHYHVSPEAVDPANDVDHSTSMAEVVLAAVARKRGYMTDHERPNRSRAARDVLKDFVDGKMVYVHPPPDMTSIPKTEAWAKVSEMARRLVQSAESAPSGVATDAPAAAAASSSSSTKHKKATTSNNDDDDSHHHHHDANEDNNDDEAVEGDGEEVEWEDMDSELDEMRDLSDDESEPDLDPATQAAILCKRQLAFGAHFYDQQNVAATSANAGSALSSEKWKTQQLQRQQQSAVRALTVDEVFNLRPEIIAFVAAEEMRKKKEAQAKIAAANAANAAASSEMSPLREQQQMLMLQQQMQQQPAASSSSALLSGPNVIAGVEVEFDEDDGIVASFAHAVTDNAAGGGKKKKRKMKSHQTVAAAMAEPDPTIRITSQGLKQVVFDDDDEIDVFVHMPPEGSNGATGAGAAANGGGGAAAGGNGQQPQKRLTKRQLRRMEKKEAIKPKVDPAGVVKRGVVGGKQQ